MAQSKLVHILPFTGAQWRYGYRTKEAIAALGHTEFTTRPANVVIGVNSVKPATASRVRTTGLQSSFISADKITEARQAGWDITPGRRSLISESRFTVPVYVTFATGLLYAWRMRKATFVQIPSNLLTAMGVQEVGANDRGKVFYGANVPKPPKAKYLGTTPGANQGDPDRAVLFESFVDPSKIDSLPEGFTVLSRLESESIT